MSEEKPNVEVSKDLEHLVSKFASAQTMLNATNRSNDQNRSQAYFYGNLGDSIERRFSGDGYSLLGGGNDYFQGTYGTGGTWQASGYGNYFGAGLLNGDGRMFSGVHNNGLGGFQYLKRFSTHSAFNHSVIAQCMLAYLGYGVVRNIIDLYTDFACEGLEIYHTDKSVENFYKAWAKKVGLKERIHSLFSNLFVGGNVFCHRRWATLSESEIRTMKRARATEIYGDMLIARGEDEDEVIEPQTDESLINWHLSKKEVHIRDDSKNGKAAGEAPSPRFDEEPEVSNKIPWGYTFLNPLQMEIRGRKIRGEHYWVMAIDKKDTMEISKGYNMGTYQDLGKTEINLPKEFVSRISKYKGRGAGYFAEVKLSNNELSVIQAPGKWDWFDWAVPFVYPALRALHFKDCLRNMEIRACQSVINSIFLFRLGKLQEGMPAEDEHFERLADMLQQPGHMMNILWNEAIDAEVIQADVKGIFDTNKHESADKDILTALGVPEVLLGGKGGNFSNSFIGVATVLEKLESYRDRVMEWLMGELKLIADVMGFRKLPEIRFGSTSLVDKKAQQTFLMGLYDRNIISADTLLRNEANTTAEMEASKLKQEKSLRGKNVFEPRGPFIKEPKAPGAGPAGSKPTQPNGRPGNSSTGPTGKQSNPRGPKGQGLAVSLESLEQYHNMSDLLQVHGREVLDKIESYCSNQLLRARALEDGRIKHIKQLKKDEKERLENLIYNVFSHMPAAPENDYTDDFIVQMLQSDAATSIKADVLEVYTDKIAEYSRSYGKSPSREMRRQFIVSAWTQRALMNHLMQKPDILTAS